MGILEKQDDRLYEYHRSVCEYKDCEKEATCVYRENITPFLDSREFMFCDEHEKATLKHGYLLTKTQKSTQREIK